MHLFSERCLVMLTVRIYSYPYKHTLTLQWICLRVLIFPSPPSHKPHSLSAGSGESAASLPNPTKSFPVGRKMTRANFRRRACRATRREVLPRRGWLWEWKSIYVPQPAAWMKRNQCENVQTRSSCFPTTASLVCSYFSQSYDTAVN